MFKPSPLKHREGDAQSHAPYASEEAYHKKNPDKKKEEKVDDSGPKPPPGFNEHVKEVLAKSDKENNEALNKANNYLEEKKISANDYDVNNGVFTSKKDGKILHPDDDPETYDALNLSVIGDKTIFDIKQNLDKNHPTSEEVKNLNKSIENWGTDYVHNTKWSANQLNVAQPSVMDNTRVMIPPHVDLNGPDKAKGKNEKSEGWREYDYQPQGDQDFETLSARSKGVVAKKENKTLFDIADDNPEVAKTFKQMAIAQESQAIYESKLKINHIRYF